MNEFSFQFSKVIFLSVCFFPSYKLITAVWEIRLENIQHSLNWMR